MIVKEFSNIKCKILRAIHKTTKNYYIYYKYITKRIVYYRARDKDNVYLKNLARLSYPIFI